jgi:hypothetical protein
VRALHESDTYLAILEEGQAKAGREIVIRFGEQRCGPADKVIRDTLSSITDPDRLMRMFDRAVEASTWEEILGTP